MLKRIQGLAQWCFVKVEGLFNLAFGEKLNPLYHIGQISYYLMWLIVASGLYLYRIQAEGFVAVRKMMLVR